MTVSSQGDGYRNRLNRMGATPFLLAARTGDYEMMKALAKSPDERYATGATFSNDLHNYQALAAGPGTQATVAATPDQVIAAARAASTSQRMASAMRRCCSLALAASGSGVPI